MQLSVSVLPLKKKIIHLGIALGGMNEGISPLYMAQAYTTFANNGVMEEAHLFKKIENTDGKVIAKWKSKATQVTEPEVAEKITFMLKGVVEEGTGRRHNLMAWLSLVKQGQPSFLLLMKPEQRIIGLSAIHQISSELFGLAMIKQMKTII